MNYGELLLKFKTDEYEQPQFDKDQKNVKVALRNACL